MAGYPPIDDGGELLRQAAICRAMKAPFTAAILEAASRVLFAGPRTAARIREWPGNRGHAAVGLRLAGGLHWLARSGRAPALSRLYADLGGDLDIIVAEALAAEDDFLHDWLDSPPKTNEVGRAGPIMAALLVVADRFGLPFELLELGSSAGLNLNLRRYAYDLGGVRAGDPTSPLLIRPEWRGPPPPDARVDIASTRGVEIDPIHLSDPVAAERLTAYAWPDQPERMARLAAAIAIARAHPSAMEMGDAVSWLEQALARPQPAGTIRAIFHSIVLQYISEEGQARIRAALYAAGERATADRPLAWISFEWNEERGHVELRLISWPDGKERQIATCQAHGAWIDWTG